MKANIQDIFSDPVQFIARLKVIGKDGVIVDLIPNEEQIKMIESLLTGDDCLFLKPRQIGASTIVSAFLFWRWYTSKEPITVAILSHKLSSAKHLLHMYKFFYSKLPRQLRRELIVENATELVLKDSGAKIMAVSGEASGGLRSFTCNTLHISEYAFTPNPEELKATAVAALNGNQLIIESTANHYGDAFHREVLKAQRGEGHWNFRFFGWNEHLAYKQDYPVTYEPVERDYMDKHRLSLGQMYWRDVMVSRLGMSKFQREYPLEIKDAFAQKGTSYFSDDDMRYTEVLNIEPENNKYYQFVNADPDSVYGIGVDVASGRGLDYSVITVVDKTSFQPVAMFRSNTTTPVQLAERIIQIATQYNEAKVLVEENNWGLPVLNELRHRGYFNLWKSDKDNDWVTSTKSKIIMFEELKALFYEGVITNIDSITYAEMRSYQLCSNNLAPKVPDSLDHHGDTVIALALACQCLKKVYSANKAFLPDWIRKRRAQKIVDDSLGIAEKRN